MKGRAHISRIEADLEFLQKRYRSLRRTRDPAAEELAWKDIKSRSRALYERMLKLEKDKKVDFS